MSYKISFDEFTELIKGESFDSKTCNKEEIINKLFKGYVKQDQIDKNLFLTRTNLTLKYDTSISTPQTPLNDSILCLTIPVSTGFLYSYESKKTKSIHTIKENSTDIIIANGFSGTSNINKNTSIQAVQINIKKDFLLKNFSKEYEKKINTIFEMKKDIKKLSCSVTNIRSLLCANELLNKDNEEFGSLYMQSKVLEILSYELPLLFKNETTQKSDIKFSEYDLRALEKARVILSTNFHNPPSILELSKMVKLNTFKLKYGYKNKYGETPYTTISNCRMRKGKELLEKSELNVTEIAHQLGYKQSCNFTKAFIGRYNIRPKDLIKTRKYYY